MSTWLWGHHFTSVVGAARLSVPLSQCSKGWWPAFLWGTLGTIFFVGMHAIGYADGEWLWGVIDSIILVAAVWVVLAAISSMVRTRNKPL